MARREITPLGAGLTHALLALVGVSMVLPFLWMLVTSVKSESEVFQDHVLPQATVLGDEGQELETVDGETLYAAVPEKDENGQNRIDADGKVIHRRGEPLTLELGNPILQGSKGDRASARTAAGETVVLTDDEGVPVRNRDVNTDSVFLAAAGGQARYRDPRKLDKYAEPVLVAVDAQPAGNQDLARAYFARYSDTAFATMIRERWHGHVPLMITAELCDEWSGMSGKPEPLTAGGNAIRDPTESDSVLYYQYKDLSWSRNAIGKPLRFKRRPARLVTDDGRPIAYKAPFPIFLTEEEPLKADEGAILYTFVGEEDTARPVAGGELALRKEFRLLWSNYVTVLADPEIKMSLYAWNSMFIAVCVVLLKLTTSSLAAFAFARLEWPGRDKVFFAYLATMMIPGIVVAIPNYLLLQQIGWLDTFYALIVPAASTAYGTFMLRQYMLTLPKGLEEAALIDGAGLLRVWWDIVLPLCKPALITLAIFTFATAWQSFSWPLIVAPGENTRVLAVALKNFSDNQTTAYNLLMAASLVMMIPMLLLFMFGQKYFIKGIQLGGVKG